MVATAIPTSGASSSSSSYTSTVKCKMECMPEEILSTIIHSLDRSDILNVQSVSRYFRALASRCIYRNLSFFLTTERHQAEKSPAFRLAETLQTINTSTYDYAQHIRYFCIAVAPQNETSRTSAVPSNVTACQLVFNKAADSIKFLNTHLLLMLRKAAALEIWHWNLPVPMSPAVYKALYDIETLKQLAVRSDRGTPEMRLDGRKYPTFNKRTYKRDRRRANCNDSLSGGNFWSGGHKFYAYRNLVSLCLIDLQDLSYLKQISECITASSSTLKSIIFTLVRDDVDRYRGFHDGGDGTHFQPPNALPFGSESGGGDAKDAPRSRKKALQDEFLARVFDLQPRTLPCAPLSLDLQNPEDKDLDVGCDKSVIDKFDTLLKSLTEHGGSLGKPGNVAEITELRRLAETYISKYGESQSEMITAQTGGKKKELSPNTSRKVPVKPSNASYSPHLPAFSSKGFDTLSYGNKKFEEHNSLQGYTSKFGGNSGSGGMTFPSYNYVDKLPALGAGPYLGTSKQAHYTGSNLAQHHKYVTALQDYNTANLISESQSSKNAQEKIPFLFPQVNHKNQAAFGTPYDDELDIYHGNPDSMLKPLQSPTYSPKYPAPFIYESDYDDGSDSQAPAIKHKAFGHSKVDDLDKANTYSHISLHHGAKSKENFYDDSFDNDLGYGDSQGSDSGSDQQFTSSDEDLQVQNEKKQSSYEATLVQKHSAMGVEMAVELDHAEGLSGTSSSRNMQDYIRATHGLQLENFELQNVPMNASVVAQALDLTVLSNLTLLEVGSQDSFWTLLVRLSGENCSIRLKSIQSDDVSISLLKYTASYRGLEEIFAYRRRKDVADVSKTSNITIHDITRDCLIPHAYSLRHVVLRNRHCKSWDLDIPTMQILAVRCIELRELSVSIGNTAYQLLHNILPVFRSLKALHLLVLRQLDTHRESLTYLTESSPIVLCLRSLMSCADETLEYIAIANIVAELNHSSKHNENLANILRHRDRQMSAASKLHDRKGKGKGKDESSSMVYASAEEGSESKELRAVFDELKRAQNPSLVYKQIQDVQDVRIFSDEVRLGQIYFW